MVDKIVLLLRSIRVSSFNLLHYCYAIAGLPLLLPRSSHFIRKKCLDSVNGLCFVPKLIIIHFAPIHTHPTPSNKSHKLTFGTARTAEQSASPMQAAAKRGSAVC